MTLPTHTTTGQQLSWRHALCKGIIFTAAHNNGITLAHAHNKGITFTAAHNKGVTLILAHKTPDACCVTLPVNGS